MEHLPWIRHIDKSWITSSSREELCIWHRYAKFYCGSDLMFWTRNNLWPLSGNHISKISSILPGHDPNKISFSEGTLSAFMWFYHSASQKSRAHHVHEVPEIWLLVTISSLGNFSYCYFFLEKWLKGFKTGLVSKQRFSNKTVVFNLMFYDHDIWKIP